ncbi:hypothetical protein [Hymenobacter sp. BT730]|uniref:DUF6056 family protein n=1 Tax=Hymenobacter sp. BT730 TaxID=3063332 RepID=UPI0026E005AD|nr:hypothetical protein [Hymenobacter sp. BT730]
MAVSAYTVLSGGTISKRVRWAGGSILVLLYFLWLPSPTEAFYWFISGLAYTVPCILGLALLAVMGVLPLIRQHSLRGVFWVIASLLAFFAPAFSEVTACIAIAGGLVSVPVLWKNRSAAGWWWLTGLALLSAILLLSAPGNFSRIDSMKVQVSVPHAVFTTTVAVAYMLVNWLGSGILVLVTILLLPWLHQVAVAKAAPIWQRLTRNVWWWPLFFGMGLYSSFLLTYLAIDTPPPPRCFNILYLFFMVSWWMSVFGWIGYRVRKGHAAPQLSGPARLLVGGLIFVALWSNHDVPLERLHINRRINTVVSAYSDWLSGNAARYDQEQQARYRLLTAPIPDVVLPPLTVKLKTIYFNDLSSNPHWWGNVDFAACFGKRSLRVAVPAAVLAR